MLHTTHSQRSVLVYSTVTNDEIAGHLDEIAELLEAQRANGFRVRAYRKGAETIRGMRKQLQTVLEEEGVLGLVALPDVGLSLASVIEQRIVRGHSTVLDRLRGDASIERVFATVPGIGPELAARIHEHLKIDTLEELEQAAHDGTLEAVPGIGWKRALAVKESLAGRFRQPAPHAEPRPGVVISVAEILGVDTEYLHRVSEGTLIRITPRRFNPQRQAWLPILHTERDGQHFTALFSNTARAHELGRTHDWVIIHHDDQHDGHWTVVTERNGNLKGRRVVRGREQECQQYYALADKDSASVTS